MQGFFCRETSQILIFYLGFMFISFGVSVIFNQLCEFRTSGMIIKLNYVTTSDVLSHFWQSKVIKHVAVTHSDKQLL